MGFAYLQQAMEFGMTMRWLKQEKNEDGILKARMIWLKWLNRLPTQYEKCRAVQSYMRTVNM